MSQQDPFEAFRKSADQERAFPFQEEDWQDLERRLETTLPPKAYPSPWWLLLLLLPVLGLMFSLHNREQAQYTINHQLLSEIEQLRTELSGQNRQTAVVLHDTVVVERVVYRDRPTVKKNGTLTNNTITNITHLTPYGPFSYTSPSFLRSSSSRGSTSPLANATSELLAAKASNAPVDLDQQATEQFPIQPFGEQLVISSLPNQVIDQLFFKANLLEGLPKVKPYLKRPEKIRLIRPPLIRSLDLTIDTDVSIAAKPPQANLLSFSLAARLNARLGKGWLLFTGLASRVSIYELDSPDASLGIPVVDAPAEGYIFRKVQVDEGSNWWLLGTGWELPSRNRWRPYLEVSYRKSLSHVSELDYAFQSLDGSEVTSEINTTLTRRPQDLLMGGAGIWYVPKRSTLQFGLGSTWSFPLKTDLLNQPRVGVNIRLGVDF